MVIKKRVVVLFVLCFLFGNTFFLSGENHSVLSVSAASKKDCKSSCAQTSKQTKKKGKNTKKKNIKKKSPAYQKKKRLDCDTSSVLLGNNISVYSTYMYTNTELKLLTCIIQAEAGNQPYKGKVAVGNVVLNRVNSDKYADSIKGVIYQPGQFEPVSNGSMANKLNNYSKMSAQTQSCYKAAKAALAGENYIGDKLYFRVYSDGLAQRAGEGNWQKIGAHIFMSNWTD